MVQVFCGYQAKLVYAAGHACPDSSTTLNLAILAELKISEAEKVS